MLLQSSTKLQSQIIQWYYTKGGEIFGPVDDRELRRLTRSYIITPDDYVWNEKMGESWKLASSLSFLFLPKVKLQNSPIPKKAEWEIFFSNKGTDPELILMRKAKRSLQGCWATAVLGTFVYLLILSLPEFVHSAILPNHKFSKAFCLLPSSSLLSSLSCPFTWATIALLSIFVVGPLNVGMSRFYINIERGFPAKLWDISVCFRSGAMFYWKTVKTTLHLALIFLGWTILFLLPSVMAFGVMMLHHAHLRQILLWPLALAVTGAIALIIKLSSYAVVFFILADDYNSMDINPIQRSKQIMHGKRWRYLLLRLRFLGWDFLAFITAGIGLLFLLPYTITTKAHFYDILKTRLSDNLPDS